MADTTGSITAPVEDGKIVNAYTKKKEETGGSNMGYDQFLTLLCAEMQYQDPLEPTSNTEYVAQLATFSQLEAMLGMQDTQKNEMANGLVGKYVILKPTDATTGKTTYVDGKVDYVMYLDTLDTVADSDYYEAMGYAKSIENMLDQLPDLENITGSYETAIKQIRDLYDGLTDYQKGFVSDKSLLKLQQYEQKVKEFADRADAVSGEDEASDKTEDTADNTATDDQEVTA